MSDVSEIVDEMERLGMDRTLAYAIAGRLIDIGIKAAPYRKETIAAVADLEVERRLQRLERGR